MKFRVTQDVDYVMGYLRYGHFEGIVEADSEEELKEKLKDPYFHHDLELVVDDYRVEDYGDRGEYEWEEIND